MILLGRAALKKFIQKHTDAKKWINNWVADIEGADWKTTHDVKKSYPTASFLKNCVIIFNVKGNTYRLETIVAFETKIVTATWAGTHAEYDKRYK